MQAAFTVLAYREISYTGGGPFVAAIWLGSLPIDNRLCAYQVTARIKPSESLNPILLSKVRAEYMH